MKCPVCEDTRMREVEKDGILIDVCPNCKGVWLDRGELDKLMAGVREVRQEFNEWYYGAPQPGSDKATHAKQQYLQQPYPSQPYPPQPYPPKQYPPQPYPQQPYPQQSYPQQPHPQHSHGYPPYGYGKYGKHYPYKKKKSVLDILGDLFD